MITQTINYICSVCGASQKNNFEWYVGVPFQTASCPSGWTLIGQSNLICKAHRVKVEVDGETVIFDSHENTSQ